MDGKICIILGTRPEIIKMAPIILFCKKKQIDFFTLHTGQHYSREMDLAFFEELKLPPAKYNIKIGSLYYSEQVGIMKEKIQQILKKEKPKIVLVEGDTNSVISGAISAKNEKILLGHVEAGLRSYDLEMVEEINRTIADHLSDYLFAPTKTAKANLLKEKVYKNKIFLTGNTIADAIKIFDARISKSKIHEKLNLKEHGFIYTTMHRAENVDKKHKLKNILKGLKLIQKKTKKKIILPLHPRTMKKIHEFSLKIPREIQTTKPIGFFDSLLLQKLASAVITDSGGIQEESCILGTPCVTIREKTERQETVEIGANILAGTDPKKMLASTEKMLETRKQWKPPYGRGISAQNIIKICEKI